MKPAPRRWQVADSAPLPGHPAAARAHPRRARPRRRQRRRRSSTAAAAFHDPLGLRGMAAAVEVLGAAIRAGERIAVYGDYDADGVTACAMLSRALRRAGVDTVPYIPNRMSEGYGLHGAALAELYAQGVRCVITVDCGTSSVDVAAGRPAGDAPGGHRPPPPARARRRAAPRSRRPTRSSTPSSRAASTRSTGSPAQGWRGSCSPRSRAGLVPGSADDGLGLAALGTVADMMPLRGENRLIVQRGLPRLRDHAGIRALCQAAGLSGDLRATDIGFGIGPRINAAGRMEDAKLALDLCLCDDEDAAVELAAASTPRTATARRPWRWPWPRRR